MLKITKKNNETNRHMFASFLYRKLQADYISVKVIFFLEPTYLPETILPRQIEVIEKIFKFYIAMKTPAVNDVDDLIKFGHNLKKLREKCCIFDPIFADPDLTSLTASIDDAGGKFLQFLKYGSQKEIEGFSANIGSIMLLIDKFFFFVVQKFDSDSGLAWCKIFTSNSWLKYILTESTIRWKNKALLQQAVSQNNPYIGAYKDYCDDIDMENEILNKKRLQAS